MLLLNFAYNFLFTFITLQKRNYDKSISVTSLEALYNYAFNAVVSQGSWAAEYGPLSNINFPMFCSGDSEGWLLDDFIDPSPDSDLARVLESGVFKAGGGGFDLYDPDGNLIEGTDAEGNSYGPAINFVGEIVSIMSNVTESELVLEWTLFNTSQSALQSLYDGTIDAVTPSWGNNGLFQVDTTDTLYAREKIFSFAHCSTFSESSTMRTLPDTGITTFNQLIQAANDGFFNGVCVAGDNTTQSFTSCQGLLDKYQSSSANATCIATGDESPFDGLESGICQAVLGGDPGEDVQYNQFELPEQSVAGR